jgi:hypothetical protein
MFPLALSISGSRDIIRRLLLEQMCGVLVRLERIHGEKGERREEA